MNAPNLSLVIPCQNEALAIPGMLDRVDKTCRKLNDAGITTEVLVVDDGSTDGSTDLLRKFPRIQLIACPIAGGYGTALQTGFAKARGEWIAFLDMDRTYEVEDLDQLLKRVRGERLDMIYGRRQFSESGMPATRSLGNSFYAWALRMFFQSPISDVCTGFRIFHRRRLEEVLGLSCTGLNFSIQLTLHTLLRGWKIAEEPVGYEERVGQSKLSLVKDGLSFLWIIVRARALG